jgi:hypothetical protein
MTAQRFPLSWPSGWPRTPYGRRQHAKFYGTKHVSYPGGGGYTQKTDLSVGEAVGRLAVELKRLGVRSEDWLISSNLQVRLDGLPYSNQSNAPDPGVAVYFRLKKSDRVLACDAWHRVADNIASIAAHIEALRAIDRYKVGTLDQAFAGYTALPAKGSTWRTTLGFPPDAAVTVDEVDRAFRERARTSHPDVNGGSHDAMASLTQARDEARRELSA